MQTQQAAPATATTDKSNGSKIFFGLFGTALVICYLLTFWIFLNGLGLLVGGVRTTATVTGVTDATKDGTPTAAATTPIPANANNFSLNTKDAASQYDFHFTTADGRMIEKSYVTTAYDLGAVGDKVQIVYNPSNPEDFIVDGFLPMFYYVGKNCLLFVTLTILIIVGLVRLRVNKKKRAAAL